jgi:hypothetical protein
MGLTVPRIGKGWTAFKTNDIVKLARNRHHLKKGTVCRITTINGTAVQLKPLTGGSAFETFSVSASDIKQTN